MSSIWRRGMAAGVYGLGEIAGDGSGEGFLRGGGEKDELRWLVWARGDTFCSLVISPLVFWVVTALFYLFLMSVSSLLFVRYC